MIRKTSFVLLLVIIGLVHSPGVVMAEERRARELLVTIILSEGAARDEAVSEISKHGDQVIKTVVESWRVGEVFTFSTTGDNVAVALLKVPGGFKNIATGELFHPPADPVVSRPPRKLRKKLKAVVDFLDLESPDPAARIATVQKMGLSRDTKFIPILRGRINKQTDPIVEGAFREAVSMLLLTGGTEEEQLEAVVLLGDLKSYPARDLIGEFKTKNETVGGEKGEAAATAAAAALRKIDAHQSRVDFFGTLFRGLSLGSVLLLVAYGLAITFGLMGIINMAHGEFIAIGGYTVYLVQGFFERTYGAGTTAYESYFLWALPASFLTAAILGIFLERGVIRFLYKRPLESLLATWGVSMVMQQFFRFQFGAANVAVSSPDWLSGSYNMAGVTMSYSRIFVIGFALVVIAVTWLLLSKTNWGLHVRATMQNRAMASCLGVRSTRVNLLTFAFGSGLAGLGGAFLSQIGNVGPSMGQTYIVDSFMVVVIGGVGNLIGTAVSSLGIGMVDQTLQPLLGPVMGKISVLFGIILFLQFKPGGLFPARSRSLDD